MKQKGTLRLIAGLQALAAVTGMLAAGIISVGAEEKAMTAAKGDKKSKKSKKNEVVATEKASEPTANTVSPVSANNDEELVAVIAAAISAYTKEPTTKFRVVSFKHIK